MTKQRVSLGIVIAALGVSAAAFAAEYNFYEQADKKGCASIITERGQDECARVQRAKDDACKVPVECEPDKQERTIAKYKEAKERLDRGNVADADKEQANAKARRDANPNDSSAQSEYDRATEEMRNAEKALEQFNNKYGKDIERYAQKLIDQYKSEKEAHEGPLKEARSRIENCKKVDNLSY